MNDNDNANDDAKDILVSSIENLMDEMDVMKTAEDQGSASAASAPSAEKIKNEIEKTGETPTETGFGDHTPCEVEVSTESKSIHLLVETVKKHDLFVKFCDINAKPFTSDPVNLSTHTLS